MSASLSSLKNGDLSFIRMGLNAK